MSNKDLAKHWSEKTGIPIERIEKLIRINTKKNYKSTYDGIYNEETGETILEAKDRITREFLKEYPQFRDFLGRSGFGGRRRSTYGSINEFNEKYPETKNEKKLTRYKYLDKKKQQEDKINLTKEQQAIENKKLNELEAYFIAIQEFMKKNPESAMLFISFYQDGGSAGMGSMVRVSFPYKIYTVDQRTRKPNYKDNMREEHNHPANQIHSALLYAAMEGNVKRAFVGLRASIMQGSIKIDADNAINDGSKNIYGEKMKLKSAAPDIWFDEILPRIMSGDLKIEDGMGAVVRLAIQGVNLNELMIVGKNQTIAEHFGVGIDAKNMTDAQIEFAIPIQNHLIIKQMTGGITKRKATNIIKRVSNIVVKSGNKEIKVSLNNKKAVINTFQFSKSGKSKGMSTFDFDDTLAFTKSGVRVTMPNTDGKPKPRRKVIFLAGGAGSGKGNVVSKLGLEEQGFKIVNQDISLEWLKKNSGLPADMRDLNKEQRSTLGKLGHQARGIAKRKMLKFQGRGDGVVVDGTGASLKQMQKLVAEFEAKGYDVSMVFVETSLPVALDRNRARKERSLLDVIVRKNHEAVMNNKEAFKEIFGDRFMEVNTDTLTQKDQMPKELIDQMHDFVFSYEKRRLDAAEFAEQGDSILEEGGEFDFSEFNNVVDGTPGPLLQKARNRADKYGTQDMFVLTARPQASAKAIHEFLKSQGLNIPISNITGLGNSTGNAKAQWMLSKFAEGYNDIYFVDDAIQNVDAVKQVLDQLDIKSNVVQAKRQFSKSASQNFNTILEESQGTSRDRTFSAAEAKRAGKNKGWWRIFVPPSAEDFKGLLYRFLGTGRQGELHMEWFKIKLLDPFAKGIRAWNIYKQEMVNEYKQLRKDLPQVTDMLQSEVEGTGFTVDHAIRVYLWDKAGYDIPGLDQATKEELIEFVTGYVETQAFADILGKITKTNEGYVKPSNGWSIGSIATDLNNVVNKVGRKEFLAEYLHNVDMIFTAENINKIEALYGTEFKEALENILYRMENGGNRRMSTDRNVNRMYNWINGSIGAIMFFNMRSALLQTISTVNFINWHDNNIFKASAAFANQTQFWSDFAMLFNSPMLKQRRAGIQIDVSASELSRAFTEGKGTPQGVIDWLLEKGFTPTQIADSFAIAFGGASMYRNRLDTYLKQGYSQFEAHEKAMLDFQEVAEATQQSSREDLISQQQASPLGRLILAFQNVTMQYTRQMKKATSDLIHGRGDMKTNISKILYYGMVQNIVFGALQSALAMIMWGDDEEEIENRTTRTLNSALDSFLRGTGIYGAIVSTIKNTIIQAEKQKKKTWNREDGRTLLEIVNLSPPIGSKLRKIYNAIKTEQYNKGVSEELGLRIENPTLYKWASIVEALTNIPTQRLVKKANNLEEAITGNHEMWQRIFLGLGWNKWDLGVKDEELEAAKAEAKKNRKTRNQENKDKERKDKGLKQVRCSATKSNGKRCGMTTWTDKKSWTCVHHSDFKDGMDRDNDGIKEYRCTATKSNGRRCKNKTENTNKRCYAHQ
jgi:predicted kinase